MIDVSRGQGTCKTETTVNKLLIKTEYNPSDSGSDLAC